MVDWFTATIYFYSETDDRKYKTDITESELSYILKNCQNLNELAKFLAILGKTTELYDLEDDLTEKKKVRLPKIHGAKEKRYIP